MAGNVNQSRKPLSPYMIFSIAVVAFVCLLALMSDPPRRSSPSKSPTQDTGSNYDAWHMAKRFVEDYLKSPSTASFGGGVFSDDFQDPNSRVKKATDGEYVVSGWVDSQNSFGATVRSSFVVRLRYEGGGTWKMVGTPVVFQR